MINQHQHKHTLLSYQLKQVMSCEEVRHSGSSMSMDLIQKYYQAVLTVENSLFGSPIGERKPGQLIRMNAVKALTNSGLWRLLEKNQSKSYQQEIRQSVRSEGYLLTYGLEDLIRQLHVTIPSYIDLMALLKNELLRKLTIKEHQQESRRQYEQYCRIKKNIKDYQLLLLKRKHQTVRALVNRLKCLDNTSLLSDDILFQQASRLKGSIKNLIRKLSSSNTQHELLTQLQALNAFIHLTPKHKSNPHERDKQIVQALRKVHQEGSNKIKNKLSSLRWFKSDAAFPFRCEFQDNTVFALLSDQQNIKKRWPGFLFKRRNHFVNNYLRTPDRLMCIIRCNSLGDLVQKEISKITIDDHCHPQNFQLSQAYQAIAMLEFELAKLQQQLSSHYLTGWFFRWYHSTLNQAVNTECQAINHVIRQTVIPHKIDILEKVLVYMRKNPLLWMSGHANSYLKDIEALMADSRKHGMPETQIKRLQAIKIEAQKLVKTSASLLTKKIASAGPQITMNTIGDALAIFNEQSILSFTKDNMPQIESALTMINKHLITLFIKPRDNEKSRHNGHYYREQFKISSAHIVYVQMGSLKSFIKQLKRITLGVEPLKRIIMEPLDKDGTLYKLINFITLLGTDSHIIQLCRQMNKLALYLSIDQQREDNAVAKQHYHDSLWSVLNYAVNAIPKSMRNKHISTKAIGLLKESRQQGRVNNQQMKKQLANEAAQQLRYSLLSIKLSRDMASLDEAIQHKITQFWKSKPNIYVKESERMTMFYEATKKLANSGGSHDAKYYLEHHRTAAHFMGASLSRSPVPTLLSVSALLLSIRSKLSSRNGSSLHLLENYRQQFSSKLNELDLVFENKSHAKLFKINDNYTVR